MEIKNKKEQFPIVLGQSDPLMGGVLHAAADERRVLQNATMLCEREPTFGDEIDDWLEVIGIKSRYKTQVVRRKLRI